VDKIICDDVAMSTNEEFTPFMVYEWIQLEDGTITIGINEEGLSEITEITAANLPAEGEQVVGEEICGELETEEGPLNLYCPVDGKVIEINAAVVENPSLIMEDPFGDGWLFRVEPDEDFDPDEIEDEDEEEEDDEEV
jgi:glycine cleavage system H protein